MPELPEVETLRRSLEPLLLGRTFTAATLHRRDILILPGDPPGGFSRSRSMRRPQPAAPTHLLVGARIQALRRHGKQMAILSADGRCLIVQLGMTGGLLLNNGVPGAHAHLRWVLDDRLELLFHDPRRFGGLRFLPNQAALNAHWAALGPDALSISAQALVANAGTSARCIKAVLLDQAVLAGVGNIYADEALHRAAINPRRPGNSIRAHEWSLLAAAIRSILAAAIYARGSTLRDYRDASGAPGGAQTLHRVYGRGGQPCLTCGKTLKSATIAQRTTVYCPTCQPIRPKQKPTSFPQSGGMERIRSQTRSGKVAK